MVCSKCGADVPEGNSFCSSCGEPVSGAAAEIEMPGKLAMMKMMAKADPVLALVSVGWLFVAVGAFIPWSSSGGTGLLGLQSANGQAVIVVATLCMVSLLLSRSATPGPWGIVIALFAFLQVALIFQALFYIVDTPWVGGVTGGYFVSMVGVLLIAYAAFKEMRKAPAQ